MPIATAVSERVWDVFRECSAWRDASDAGVASLARASRLRRYAKNERIFAEGVRAEHVALVISGCVRATHRATTGRPVTVKMLGPGSALGVLAAFNNMSHPISKEATRPTAVALIPVQVLQDLIHSEPQVMNSIAQELANQTLEALVCVKTLSSDVPTRLAAHLLRLLEPHPADCPDPRAVDLDMSRIELSASLGTVPETLSRTFRMLEREGLIQARGTAVTVLDSARLAARAQGASQAE